jgi:iron(III)-enterobactin esterase
VQQDGHQRPDRIWMQLGDRDRHNPNVMRDDMHDWVIANHERAAAFKSKHYQYQSQYIFVPDAGHCDRKVRDQTLPEALEWAWRGYRR